MKPKGKLLPEIWAGVECTYNRVGDRFHSQLDFNGHGNRPEDLEKFAELGIKTMRFPVLWETVAPKDLDHPDWSWADDRLERLRKLQVNPIVGFLHHGSGPVYTNLMDPEFPEKLARYARFFAERYPWVDMVTPVNEPLTTARFSGLYGFWYPHARDDRSFLTALLNQIRGTVLAMRAIRKVNPHARLVQTEDLGVTTSTPLLAYQADFENERRWLSIDLLCGRVGPDRPIWKYLINAGIPEEQILWFKDNPCPPDIFGVNHYITSNRYLDENMAEYPLWSHGGNGRHAYADVETVRVASQEVMGPKVLLKKAWDRYHLPLAVTEVHMDNTREEQMRWLKEFWEAGKELRDEGVDIRAITIWSLLGAFDWNTLVTQPIGYYESGAFDLRGGGLRPTALVDMIRTLAQGQDFEHPTLSEPGWWKRSSRALYPIGIGKNPAPRPESLTKSSHPILITGGRGTLGNAFTRICEARRIPYIVVTRDQMDIADSESVKKVLEEIKPWALINAAGYVRVDDAENDIEKCFRENLQGPVVLAQACAATQTPFLTFSTDLVFDGSVRKPYTEKSPISPLNVYGRSKAEAEKKVMELYDKALIIRTSSFFGPWDEHNFVTNSLRRLARGETVVAAENLTVSPTYVPHLVDWALNLLIDKESGIWHLTNGGEITWADWLRQAAATLQIKGEGIVAKPCEACEYKAPRPSYSALGSERGQYLPPLERAMEMYFSELQVPIK